MRDFEVKLNRQSLKGRRDSILSKTDQVRNRNKDRNRNRKTHAVTTTTKFTVKSIF